MHRVAIILLLSLIAPVAEQRPVPPTTPAAQPPLDPAVKRDGWWIRIGKDVKAEKITWRFSDPERKAAPATVTWQRANDPDTFDFPETVRTLRSVSFEVTAEPPTVTSFCVFHAAEGAQLVELTKARRLTLDARARDRKCVP